MKKTVAIALTLCMALALGACDNTTKPTPETPGTPGASGTPAAPTRVAIGTGSIGANLNLSGTALANMLNKYMDNFEMSVEVTGGSGVNCAMVSDKELEFGITTDSVAYNARYGTGWANGQVYDNFRAIVALNPSALEILTVESAGVNNVMDLNGKRVSNGTTNGTGTVTGQEVYETLGITLGSKQDMGWSDAMTAMGDGMLDAVMDMGGFPSSARAEFATSNNDAKWVALTDDQIQAMTEKYPYYSKGFEPAGTYAHMDEDYQTIFVWNELICSPDVDEEVVYQIVKNIFEHIDELELGAASFQYTTLEAIQYLSSPMHVGAIRYFEEMGVTLPETAYPPEYNS